MIIVLCPYIEATDFKSKSINKSINSWAPSMGKRCIWRPPVLRILDLCSGSQSVGKAASFFRTFFSYVSVDIKSVPLPTVCEDLFNWQVPKCGSYDVVWFSPDCRAYSNFQMGHPQNWHTLEARRQQADRLVRRGLSIIDHIRPKWYGVSPYGIR